MVAAAAAALVAVAFYEYVVNTETGEIEFSKPPPSPRFLKRDNEECKKAISEHFEWAKSSYDYANAEEARLEEMFENILEKKDKYQVQLVGNEKFINWTYSGWDDTWAAGANVAKPEWSRAMEEHFGEEADPIRSVDEFEEAVDVLFDWRASYGMEAEVVFRRRRLDAPYYPAEAYGMCSAETRKYGDILVEYLYYYCCDARSENIKPMLDNIDSWMDVTYAATE